MLPPLPMLLRLQVSNHLSELDFFALATLYSVRVVAMDHLQVRARPLHEPFSAARCAALFPRHDPTWMT